MIRVFVLALLALMALVLVSRNLPGQPPRPASARESAQEDTSAFGRFDGAWEGTFNTYLADGTLDASVQVHQEYTSVSPMEQNVSILDRYADGRLRTSRGKNLVVDGRLECQVWGPDGSMKRLLGTKVGPVLFWHRRDVAAGLEETYREEIARTAEGDLYTIDGVGVYGKEGGKLLIFEGRYRRVGQADR